MRALASRSSGWQFCPCTLALLNPNIYQRRHKLLNSNQPEPQPIQERAEAQGIIQHSEESQHLKFPEAPVFATKVQRYRVPLCLWASSFQRGKVSWLGLLVVLQELLHVRIDVPTTEHHLKQLGPRECRGGLGFTSSGLSFGFHGSAFELLCVGDSSQGCGVGVGTRRILRGWRTLGDAGQGVHKNQGEETSCGGNTQHPTPGKKALNQKSWEENDLPAQPLCRPFHRSWTEPARGSSSAAGGFEGFLLQGLGGCFGGLGLRASNGVQPTRPRNQKLKQATLSGVHHVISTLHRKD